MVRYGSIVGLLLEVNIKRALVKIEGTRILELVTFKRTTLIGHYPNQHHIQHQIIIRSEKTIKQEIIIAQYEIRISKFQNSSFDLSLGNSIMENYVYIRV